MPEHAPTLATALLDAADNATRHGGTLGWIYLLHFDRPYRHAGHYTGWTLDIDRRLTEHAAGRGARLLAVITAAGITWTLARVWVGTRADERQLKQCGGASRRCPLCGVKPRHPIPLPQIGALS